MRQNRVKLPAGKRGSDQRERLLAGMLAAIHDDGYEGATVRNVIGHAGVSRLTFYDYFADKDDCFLALYRDLSTRLHDQITRAINGSPPRYALRAVVRQLTENAEREPVAAHFLASDILAGGAHALDERERAINRDREAIRTALSAASPRTPSPDLPSGAVIGATHSLIAQRMRRGERNLGALAEELTDWFQIYEQPIGKHRWSALNPGPLLWPSTKLSELSGMSLLPLASKSSHSLPRRRDQNRRRRILLATAESAGELGYATTTVGAITARARINKRDFYRHFRDKRQAFLALHELAFEQSMAVGAGAYFRSKHWPERVWESLLATSRLHAAHPAIAHVALVETHALGQCAIQRVEECRHAFTTLLRADRQRIDELPSVTSVEAVGAAIFEIARDQVRHQRAKDLPRYAYHTTYLALAPFLGVQAANRFVQRKLKNAEQKG